MYQISTHLASSWFLFLSPKQQELFKSGVELYERELGFTSNLADYSFILFPLAKTYEGFLKKYLLDLHMINRRVYEGRRFRIGRALNPDVALNQRDKYWLYDDLVRLCGQAVAAQLWEAWLECRNRVFHFFPDKKNTLTLQEVEERMELLVEAMQQAVACKFENGHS